ncbi:UDP-Glycosyltransferase/glycogen phosphorylase [Exidia glandulosa HHB12029]|uniref:UDP-Glycosyltransferase/glycogen phosphorylase n=1 Tax=Exidia glandulosa HHB12029 TaxID=1314781 RepID=A0A165LDT6_EXIGL|nr:UDP-Glycosyltransferase/glycogen phosphorylase [Exidia glandulosa HHB12029]
MSNSKLHTRSKATRKPDAGLSTVFMGVAMRFTNNTREYAVVIHDGMGVVGSERDVHHGDMPGDLVDKIIERAKEYAAARGHRIAMLAVSGPLDAPLSLPDPSLEVNRDAPISFLSRVWLELDAIPFVACVRDTQFSLQGEAVLAVETALLALAPTASTILQAAAHPVHHEVLVDANHQVRLYELHEQAKLTSPGLWETFTALANPLQKNKTKISFFSATPRGGGVALMRHSLIRVWHLLGLDVHWFVPQGDSAVFDVTKRKLHNVLQGVAPPGTVLTKEEKELFERWTEWNYNKFWKDDSEERESPLKADIIVIDDPQLTALIPIARRVNPKAKIIFRSHIEIRSDLIDAGTSPQKDVWDYLFNFIRGADVFVSHPIPAFVPSNVHQRMPVVYMPPCTDPLDGLNKPMTPAHLNNYRDYFNELMRASTGQQLDWERGYILQVARFDPSKGIPDLVEGYRLFREETGRRLSNGLRKKNPQLILIGHTSVDDPDAAVVLHELQDTLSGDAYKKIRDDIYALRAPPDDRLLDALMRGADIACQVSTREGFEIKVRSPYTFVTEAIHKRRWIIATKAGGIPLQIRDGVDGTLVPPSDPRAIADAMLDFYGSGKYERMREVDGNHVDRPLGGRWAAEGEGPREELFTIGNATMWHFLWNSVMGFTKGENGDGHQNEELVRRFNFGSGENDLWTLDGKMVWDLLKVKNAPN